MGGLGSGNRCRFGAKSTTDDYRTVDVRHWAREGVLRPGFRARWQWTRRGEIEATAEVRAEAGRVTLVSRIWTDGEWKAERHSVQIVRTPCHLGGARPWFICPAQGCGLRVAILYDAANWCCRTCLNLAYASQCESPTWRHISYAQKIRRKLGGSANLLEPFPPKPKGMHWWTYDRLRMVEAGRLDKGFRELGQNFSRTRG